MKNIYRKLFEVKLFHEFYRNSDDEYTHLDKDLDIIPTSECQNALENLGLLFRRVPGGFSVLFSNYEEDGSEHPLVPLTSPEKLSFQLFAKTPYIKHYSSLPLEGKVSGFYYVSNLVNNSQTVDGNNELLLTQDISTPYLSDRDEITLRPQGFNYRFSKPGDDATITIEDRNSNLVFTQTLTKLDDGATGPNNNFAVFLDLKHLGRGRFILKIDGTKQDEFYLDTSLISTRPFGLLEIFHDPATPAAYKFADESGNVTAKSYVVRINRRETVWKYLIGLKYQKELDPTDLEVVSDIFSATFTRKASYQLADNTEVIPFDSGSTQIPLLKEPLKGFKLKKTISGSGPGPGSSSTEETTLPNPEITHLKTDNGNIYSEVYIYL